jgi:ATP-dependent DNA helicase RecQ
MEQHLKEADQDGIIKFIKGDHTDNIRFLVPREDQYTINVIAKNIKRQRAVKIDKYKRMLDYVTNETICRNRLIDTYFDDTNAVDCDTCDVCLQKAKKRPNSPKEIEAVILKNLSHSTLSSRKIVQITGFDDDRVLQVLRELLDRNKIVLNSQNEYTLI